MAVKPWRVIQTPVDGTVMQLILWEGLSANDTGLPFVVAFYSDKSVHIDGATLGSGITIEGTLDPRELNSTDGSVVGAGWETLNDPQGTPLSSVTAQKIENVLEGVYLLRPNCAAGVVDAKVWLLLMSTR